MKEITMLFNTVLTVLAVTTTHFGSTYGL